MKIKPIMELFSFVYVFTNLLFTGKQKKVTNFLMAEILRSQISFDFENFKTNQKHALFSFVLFLLNFLFSGKQKEKLEISRAQIKVFQVPN